MAQEKIPILVTAIGGGGHGEQILKALRMVNHRRYFVVGADANLNCPQFSMVDARASLPMANDSSYLDALLAICRQYKIRALFHGCEPELKQFAKNRERIESEGIFLPINPTSVIDMCMNKEKTNHQMVLSVLILRDSPAFPRKRSLNKSTGSRSSLSLPLEVVVPQMYISHKTAPNSLDWPTTSDSKRLPAIFSCRSTLEPQKTNIPSGYCTIWTAII